MGSVKRSKKTRNHSKAPKPSWNHDIKNAADIVTDKVEFAYKSALENLNFHYASDDKMTDTSHKAIVLLSGLQVALIGFTAKGLGGPITCWQLAVLIVVIYSNSIIAMFLLAISPKSIAAPTPEPENTLTAECFAYPYPQMLLGHVVKFQERIDKVRLRNEIKGKRLARAIRLAAAVPFVFCLAALAAWLILK